MSYASAWIVIAVTVPVCLFGLYMILRQLTDSEYLRVLCCGLILAIVATPAPIPGFPQHYAPAFIVAIFEGILQDDGAPGVALRLLLAGSVALVGLITVFAIAWRHWHGRLKSQPGEPLEASTPAPEQELDAGTGA